MGVSDPLTAVMDERQAQDTVSLRWDDIFVTRRMPLRPFMQSAGAHAVALLALLGASRLNWAREIPPQNENPADRKIVYVPTPYLPPLDTRSAKARHQEKPDPAYSPQAIISLPREADNRAQTVVTPAQVKVARPQSLPNVLNWPAQARLPIAPVPVLAAETERLNRNSPRLENSIVAPPVDLARSQDRRLQSPQESVITPPPTTVESRTRNFGDINIAHSEVVAPAPQLARTEQRSYAGSRGPATASVVAPPPSVRGGSRAGQMVALNLQPAVGAPAKAEGNRRGTFAATPQGRLGGSGTPADGNGTGAGGNANAKSGLPSGLYVAKPPAAAGAGITGKAAPTRPANRRDVTAATTAKLSEEERKVFGDRRVYSITLNTPNLNSASGSWVVKFAERNPEPVAPGAAPVPSTLSAPLAIHKVDPAYPTQIMRENVSGTVVLLAVIGADGKVSQVQVLESVDGRLDAYASQALTRWEFRPATKNGTPVDVEATFRIPFVPSKNLGF